MKFNKRLKKGFTLVELIVVIAIVAILAAVSVVSYLAFINSANESADVQLVKQLNVALQADQSLNGPRDTMHEMLGAMEENGFVVENLTKTKSGYDIVWDQEHNRFGLLNGETLVYGESTYNSAQAWNIWKFADTKAEAENESSLENKYYSVYLTEEFAKTNVTSLNVKAGLDVGNYDRLTSISYENTSNNEQNVVIRTNGGTLSVNAPADKIYHYGKMEGGLLKEVAPSSFYEKGEAGYINLKKGRLVIEEEAKIEGIYLEDTNGNFDGIKLALVGDAELPTIGRANVEDGMQDGDTKLVVEIQNLETSTGTDENPEYIWITKEGENVNSTVSSSASDATQTVEKPSEAAAATQQAAEESVTPVSDNSVARIGAKGYDSFALAVKEAKTGEKIYLLKSFTLNESLGEYGEGLYDGLLVDSLANEVILTTDVEITFGDYVTITLTEGGRFTLNGNTLTLTATTSSSGILNCQQVVDENGNRIGITVEGNSVIVSEDLYFTTDPAYAPFMFDLMYYSSWVCSTGFFTGSITDARSMKENPIFKDEYTLEAEETVGLSVDAVEGATYSWSTDGGNADIIADFVGGTSSNSVTLKIIQSGMCDTHRNIFCDVYEANGSFQRYYWSVTVPGGFDLDLE